MSTLVVFLTLALTLALLLTLIVLMPWLRQDKTDQHNQLIALNVEVFQERIEELKHDYKTGVMSEAAFIEQKTELERQLLLANQDNIASVPTSNQDLTSQTGAISVPKVVSVPNRRSRLLVLISVPMLMVLGYGLISDFKPIHASWQAQDKLGQVADDLLTGKIDAPPRWASEDNLALFNALQFNVYHNSHDADRWMRLADIFMAFEADEPAFEAMSRAYRLEPNDPLIATRFAQVQFFTHGGQLNHQGLQALNTVLTQDPNHQGAMMLMIMSEVQSGRFDAAQEWVVRIRASIEGSSGDHSVALNSLDELTETIEKQKQDALMSTNHNNVDNSSQSDDINQPSDISNISVHVSINPSVQPLIEHNDILFVTVKAVSGGAPYAAKRIPAEQINGLNAKIANGAITVQLSDQDAMMPERTITSALSAGTPLVVTARISKSGQAISQSGDLSATAVPLSDIKQPINIEINSQIQ